MGLLKCEMESAQGPKTILNQDLVRNFKLKTSFVN